MSNMGLHQKSEENAKGFGCIISVCSTCGSRRFTIGKGQSSVNKVKGHSDYGSVNKSSHVIYDKDTAQQSTNHNKNVDI